MKKLQDNKRLQDLFLSPISRQRLSLVNESLVGQGESYPVIDGIPRFVELHQDTVSSFGDEWNYFNFIDFHKHWIYHVIKNTFNTLNPSEVFSGKFVVDAGAGSGSQSRWIAESGAAEVLSLELSHAVDGVIRENLKDLDNVSVIQCSIDNIPLQSDIADIVYCVNVIQHTPDVEKTVKELYRLVKPGGELVFTCYNENGWGTGYKRAIRRFVHKNLRSLLSEMKFQHILFYSKVMSLLRFIPVFGWLLEGCLFMARGEVLDKGLRAKYKAGVLNTFDMFGSHSYQHVKTEKELRDLIASLKSSQVFNIDRALGNPPAIGCAFRVVKS